MSSKITFLERGEGHICESVLRSLPDWFGIEEAILDYTEKVTDMPMFVSYDGDTLTGFISINHHGRYSSEIYVMGVLPDYHGKGIGRKLVDEVQRYLKNTETEFLQVKTLDESRESESYRKTRLFYKALGFKELEVFPTLWDENNPCLLLVQSLKV